MTNNYLRPRRLGSIAAAILPLVLLAQTTTDERERLRQLQSLPYVSPPGAQEDGVEVDQSRALVHLPSRAA